MIRFWLDRGVDGFRMDVINFISKEPGLPDGKITQPGFLQSGLEHFACGPRLHEYLQGIGAILHEYDAFSVGEMPGVTDTKEILKAVGQDRGELAMAFQFDVVTLDIDPKGGSKWEHRDFDPRNLKHIVAKWQSFMLQNAGWNAVFMENHDQGRTISRYCDDSDEHRTKSAKLLAAHMGLLSGTLFVYQGQELAQINVPESWGMDEYKDIEALNHWKTVLRDFPDDKEKQAAYRRQYRLIGRDNARTPMQWTSDKSTYAGFLPGDASKDDKPWMSIHPDFEKWNAEALLADHDSAFYYWQKILKLRRQNKDLLVYGDFEMLDLDNEFGNVVAYLRSDDSPQESTQSAGPKKCLVLTNFSEKEVLWRVPVKVEDLLFDGSGLKKGVILKDLRNYDTESERAIRKDGEEGWKIQLRPWEIIVAME